MWLNNRHDVLSARNNIQSAWVFNFKCYSIKKNHPEQTNNHVIYVLRELNYNIFWEGCDWLNIKLGGFKNALACPICTSAPTNCCWRLNCVSVSLNACFSAVGGPAVSDTARCSQTRWASGFPCGSAPSGRHSERPDHGSAPGHTKNTKQAHMWPSCSTRARSSESNPPHQLYLSMRINQQQVTHNVSLHPTEDVLTRGWAALSDQEIPAAGEEGLRLLTSQPGMKDAKLLRKMEIHRKQTDVVQVVQVLGCWWPTSHGTSPPPGSCSGSVSRTGQSSVQHGARIPLSLVKMQQNELALNLVYIMT